MNRVIRILLFFILTLSLGVFFYTGYELYEVKNEDYGIRKEIKTVTGIIDRKNEEIELLKEEIKEITDVNSDRYREYTNWQRHLQKLAEILDSE
ncbi:MAG: hypothetical protein IKF68_03235 [Erysipelotrichaceae bacterium]|nr:hypothetical protein [Erysipelotrichaceae bacterium]